MNNPYNLDIAYSTNLIFGKVPSLFYDRVCRDDRNKKGLFMYLLDLDLMLRKELVKFIENREFSEFRAMRMRDILSEIIRVNKIILDEEDEDKQGKTT